MLHFIFGRTSSQKSEYLREQISEKINHGESGFILIVPEQFSFDTERAMLHALGPDKMLSVEIFSFKRLAETVLSEFKPLSLNKITDGTKALFMSRTLETLQDEVPLYKKFINKSDLLLKLVTFVTELKQCSVTTESLTAAGEEIKTSALKEKITELSKISTLYNAMLHQYFYDDSDLLDQLADTIKTIHYFDDKTIYFDTFDGFTKQEKNIIGILLPRCKDIFISLCLEKDIVKKVPCVFDNIEKEYKSLKQLALNANVSISIPQNLPNTMLKKEKALSFLEENIYKTDSKPFEERSEDVPIQIFSAKNPADECDYVAAMIHKLLRENKYKANDIVVIERKKDSYDIDLHAAFQKYNLPFYEDKRQPIMQQPLMRYVSSLLNILANGISTENIFTYLKTGLTEISNEDVALLENYTTIWGIDYSAWSTPFVSNPDGFGKEMHDRSKKQLEHINEIRGKIVGPIFTFRKEFKDLSGTEKAQKLYDFLMVNHVDTALKKLAIQLDQNGFHELSEQQNTVWELLMQFLDSLSEILQDEIVSPKRFLELFTILLNTADLGTIPQGLDMIRIGAIDRLRISPLKVVFIVGANEGVFPENPSTEGILNDAERKVLQNFGVELSKTAEFKTIDERCYIYNALSLPTQKLFISYSLSDFKGNSLIESNLIGEICKMFPRVKRIDSNLYPFIERIESKNLAFEIMADLIHENSDLSLTLQEYFVNDHAFEDKKKSLEQSILDEPVHFKDHKYARELFGNNMIISASKAETFYKCPFSYFCKYGLQMKALKKAEIDFAQSGSLMHYVLECILRENSIDALKSFSLDALQQKIKALILSYINSKMGGLEDKDSRFAYLLMDLSQSILDVILRLLNESKVSSFVPTDFELPIDFDGKIQPYTLTLDNGDTISVIGSVDRVDIMEKDGKKYFRIIDYKSGGKSFRLSDVSGGLNMQMLIYLFAICENGKEYYGPVIPAGVLYLPAKVVTDKLKRNAKEEDIKESKLKNSRMDGMILRDLNVILGMDKEVSDTFVHVKKKGDDFKGSLLSQEELEILKKKINHNLITMATRLHDGDIPILPTYLNQDNVACKYCDYKSICGYEEGNKIRVLNSTSSFDRALKSLVEEEGEQS